MNHIIPLTERVDDLVAWARSRIEHCRKLEAKFARDPRPGVAAETTDIIAARERMTLQTVLSMLGVSVSE